MKKVDYDARLHEVYAVGAKMSVEGFTSIATVLASEPDQPSPSASADLLVFRK